MFLNFEHNINDYKFIWYITNTIATKQSHSLDQENKWIEYHLNKDHNLSRKVISLFMEEETKMNLTFLEDNKNNNNNNNNNNK